MRLLPFTVDCPSCGTREVRRIFSALAGKHSNAIGHMRAATGESPDFTLSAASRSRPDGFWWRGVRARCRRCRWRGPVARRAVSSQCSWRRPARPGHKLAERCQESWQRCQLRSHTLPIVPVRVSGPMPPIVSGRSDRESLPLSGARRQLDAGTSPAPKAGTSSTVTLSQRRANRTVRRRTPRSWAVSATISATRLGSTSTTSSGAREPQEARNRMPSHGCAVQVGVTKKLPSCGASYRGPSAHCPKDSDLVQSPEHERSGDRHRLQPSALPSARSCSMVSNSSARSSVDPVRSRGTMNSRAKLENRR